MKNSIYVCQCCGHKFQTPKNVPEKTGVVGCDGFAEVVYRQTCPVCGMAELAKHGVCSNCGGLTDGEQETVCADCKDKVRWSFREYLKTLKPWQVDCLDELLNGTFVREV